MKVINSDKYGTLRKVNTTVKCAYCRANSHFQCVFIGEVEYNGKTDSKSGRGTLNTSTPQCSKCGKLFDPIEILKVGFRKMDKETQHK